MAFDKNSTVFTFTFAIVMVVIVGVALAFTSLSLKDLQNANKADKKMMNILGAIRVEATRDNAQELFGKYVEERISIDVNGNVVNTATGPIKAGDKSDPFNIDVQKDYRSNVKRVVKVNKGQPETMMKDIEALGLNFPVFKCNVDGKITFVVPVVGTGLWGPIWGFVALEEDYQTIYGATFDHQGETPGLGAEIKEAAFYDQFIGKELNKGSEKLIEVVKAGIPSTDYRVDGITGGTITSKGVEEMVNRTFEIYNRYFQTKAS
jgi:Na+-transporting NADH:ubiquinone oxidoreductase subunit C